jgi:oligopeptide transport system substrate-binding protein
LRIAAAAGALVVALAVVLSGCSATAGAGDTVITVNGSEPQNPLIPVNTTELGGARVVDNIFAGLVTYDTDGSVLDELADDIDSNPEKTIFTVVVRGDQTFSNGDRVDAESFITAWDWAADSANETASQSSFRDIVGYTPDDPRTPDEVERGSLIEAGGLVLVDSQTFEIHLKTSQADFVQRLGQRAFFPLPSVFFDDIEGFGEHPIGNGPYMLDGPDAWHHGERIDLVLNPGYKGPRAPVNGGVSMVFYDDTEAAYVDMHAGFLDVLDTLPASALPNLEGELGSHSVDQPSGDLQLITIPMRLAHFTGKEGPLRRAAISRAIDRVNITEVLYAARKIPAVNFATPIVEGYSDDVGGAEVLDYDDKLAQAAWAEAEELKKPWGDSTFQIAYTSPGDKAWVDAVAASISRVLGIDAIGVPYATDEEFAAAVAEGKTAFVTSRSAGYPGLLSYISSYISKAPGNLGAYTSKAFDAQIRSGAITDDIEDRNLDYQGAQRVLLADLPAIPLWYSTVQAGYADTVGEVTLDWQGVPQYFSITRS